MEFFRLPTGVGSFSLLQGKIPYSPWNSSSYPLEWVAFPFSKGSSQPRNQIGVSCIAGGFFTNSYQGSCYNAMLFNFMLLWHHWLNGHEFWASSGRQWRKGKPGVLQFMGSQRVRHNLVKNNNNNAQITTDLASGSYFSLAFVFYWYVIRIPWEFFHSLI